MLLNKKSFLSTFLPGQLSSIKCQMQPLPQHAHQGILPLLFECDVMDIFRRDEVWLMFPSDSRDEDILLQIDEAVDPPMLLQRLPP